MGYLKIPNLYKCKEILTFPELCVTEKIHGTSTYLYLKDKTVKYHCGGETEKTFGAIFDKDMILQELTAILTENSWINIRVHGEAYGGKQQKMAKTYGNVLKFIVFDIRINIDTPTDRFLDVLDAERIAHRLGLEFVPYVVGPATAEFLDEQANLDSVQSVKNGMGSGNAREGIVVGPMVESKLLNGDRAICKHKNRLFWELTNERPLTQKIIAHSNDNDIALDWVTDMRARHVIDKMMHDREEKKISNKETSLFVDKMLQDIVDESEGEIIWTIDVKKAIRRRAGGLFIGLINSINLEYNQ